MLHRQCLLRLVQETLSVTGSYCLHAVDMKSSEGKGRSRGKGKGRCNKARDRGTGRLP